MDHSMHDMSGHGSSSSGHSMGGMDMGGMDMTFHWSITNDPILFSSWKPKSEPAYIGACIGLFVFAVLSRGCLALEVYFMAWRQRRLEQSLQSHDSTDVSTSQTRLKDRSSSSDSLAAAEYPVEGKLPMVPPFNWINDPVRSFLTAFSSFIGYLLMLIVMTGNGGFFIVIMVGIFVGEVAFGRFRSIGGIKGSGDHDH